MHRRRVDGNGIADELVEDARLDAHRLLLGHVAHEVRHARDALARQGRGIEHRRVLQEAELVAQFLGEAQRRLIVLVRVDIPLVDDDDDALARLVCIARDLLVLLRDALEGVDHHEHDVGAVDGAQRAHDTVTLDGLLDLAAAAHACRVDQRELHAVLREVRVDGVTRRARHVADDDAVLAEDRVDDGGFADIRAADDGDADLILILALLDLLREGRDDCVEQIAEIHRIRCRDGDRIAEAQIVELVDVHRALRAVNLVDREDDRLLRAAQQARDLFICRRQAGAAVDEEQDDVGLLHGQLCLLAHRLEDVVALIELDAAGVDHREVLVEPLRVEIDAVARDARHVVDDGDALLADLIEERGLADVRAADNRHDWFAHIHPSFSIK